MNYEFHVGDYVKTIGGFVGWISNIKDNNYIVITDENNNICGYYLPQDERYFVRIGAYDVHRLHELADSDLTDVSGVVEHIAAHELAILYRIRADGELQVRRAAAEIVGRAAHSRVGDAARQLR